MGSNVKHRGRLGVWRLFSIALLESAVVATAARGQDSLTARAEESGYFYIARGRAVPLAPRADRAFFAVDPEDEGQIESIRGGHEEVARFRTASGLLQVVTGTGAQDLQRLRVAATGYRAFPQVKASGPVFDLGDGERELIVADEIVLQVRGGLTEEEVGELLTEYGLVEIVEYPTHSGRMLVRSSRETLDVAQELYADERVELASPNFYHQGESLSTVCSHPVPGWGGATDCTPLTPPSGFDTFSNSQWQWDVACVWQAWALPASHGRGDSSVYLYHNDIEGFDFDHADIAANLERAADFTNTDIYWRPSTSTSFQFTATHADTAVYLFHRLGSGETVLDNVSLKRSGIADELVPNGDFESGQGAWQFLGVYAESAVIDDGPPHNKVLLLKSTATTADGSNCVKLTLSDLVVGAAYDFKVEVKRASFTLTGVVKLGKATDFPFQPPNLERQFIGFPKDDHGSAIAGILAGNDGGTGNTGIMGVAPDCRILFSQGSGNLAASQPNSSFFEINSLYWAGNSGARVVNYSWLMYLENDDLLRALRRLAGEGSGGRGAVVTVAAGNAELPIPKYYVAAHPLALAVSASLVTEQVGGGVTETRDCGHAFGEALDLLAPNRKQTLAGPLLTWTTASYSASGPTSDFACLTETGNAGTSYCAPFVGGIAGLMIGQDDTLRRDEVAQILFHTASTDFDLGACASALPDPISGRSDDFGYGRVDAEAAVEHVLRGARWPEPPVDVAIEPVRVGLAARIRLQWTNPDRNFSGIVVFKSTVPDQRVTFRPADAQGTGPGYTVGDTVPGGKVIYVGSGTDPGTSFTDAESTPGTGSIRYYTVFAYNESQELVNGQPVTWRRWSFGKEARIRKGSLRFVHATSSLSSVLQSYTLLGGDLVSVASGSYLLSAPVVWGAGDQGSAEHGDVFLVGESIPTDTGGPLFLPQAGFTGSSALSIAARYITVKNVGFKSFSAAGTAAIEVLPAAEPVRLLSNRISGCAVGIRVGQTGPTGHAGPVLVQNNIVLNTGAGVVPGAIAIHCPKKPTLLPGGFGGRYTLVNNTIVMVDGTGVQLEFQPFQCSGCGSALNAMGGHTVELYNNILHCDATTAQCASSLSACIRTGGLLASNYNDLLGPVVGYFGAARKCDLAEWTAAAFADKDSIASDPGFVDPTAGDYRLQNHSECVNRGQLHELLGQSFYPMDYFAGAVPQRIREFRVDIGADEVDAPDMGQQFIRGDSNEDGAVEQADAVYTLSYLFSGGPPPVCIDAADADDNDQIQVTDAIYTLNFLFLAPNGALKWLPPPYPDCGVDPFGFTLFCSQNKPTSPCPP